MKKNILIILFLAFCILDYSFAQNANISYEVRVNNVQGTEGSSTSGSSCWELGDDEYTANLRIDDVTTGTNFCLQCNAGTGCTFGGGTVLRSSTNVATTIYTCVYDLYEDDGGSRCSWGSGDDCRAVGSFNVSNISIFPAAPNAYNGSVDVRVYNSGSSTWNIRLFSSWRYSGTSSSITPTCAPQSITYTSGNIRSNSVYLTAGRTYRFQTTAGADTYLRLYGSDGYTIVASGDDYNGTTLSQIIYTPTSSGWYYIEGSDYTRANLSLTTTLEYEDVTPAPGNPAVFGNGTWNVYAYTGGTINLTGEYSGFYTEPNLSYNTTNRWNANNSPSEASGFQGCYVPVDNHVLVSKRTGFTCGNYQIDINGYDDQIQVYVNGALVFSNTTCCLSFTNVWTGLLNSSSTVEVRHLEGGGGSSQAITMTNLTTTALNSGAHNITALNVCDGSNPANLTFTTATSGGVTPYSYQWQNNGTDIGGATANSYDPPALTVGNYSYRCKVTDACGNISYTTAKAISVVADPNAPSATKVPNTNSVCIGSTLTISNPLYGSDPGRSCGFEYAFSTDNGSTWSATSSSIPSFVSTGSVNKIRVRVAGGCADACNASSWTEYTWTVNATPSANVTGTNAICAGASTTFTASGGTNYLWSTGAATAAINPSIAQTYNVTVTDANGCTATANRTLTVNANPTAAISNVSGTTELTCNTTSISLLANGGLTYSWSNGQNLASNSVSSPNTYAVTVTDANGCTSSASTSITQNITAPTAAIAGTNTICSGNSTTFTASGGGTYNWSTGASTSSISVSTGQTYNVTVTAANGCTATSNRALTVNATPSANVTGTNAICAGASTTFTASGGTSYLWSTGAATAAINPSTAQTYNVTVTDANGCTATANRALTVNANPTAAITNNTGSTELTCNRTTIDLTASGGSTFAWNNSLGSNASQSVSSPGSYSVTVTDANGCTASTSAAITQNITAPTASISGTNTICSGNSTTFTASGGSSYSWSNGASTSSISVSTGQSYTVTVTGANGCTATDNRTLTVNTTPSAPTASATQTFCTGVSSTVADLTTTSGSGIQWYTAASGGTALTSGTALSNGTYYASQSTGSCESSRLAVSVTTNAQPTDPAGIATNDVLWKGGAANPNDWSTASNWYVKTAGGYTVAPATPAATTNVFVGNTGSCINNSVVNLAGLTRCKNLYIESGATLNLGGSSDVLEVYGNWDNNGTLNANTSTVKFISPNNQSLNTAATTETFYNLYIDNNNSSNQNYLLMNKSVKVMNTFHMEGNVRMNTSTMLEIGSSSNPGEVLWHDGVVIGPMRRWFLGNSSINVQSPSFHNVTTGSPHLNPAGIFPVGVLRTLPGGAVEHEHKNASVNFKTPVTTAGHLTVEFITSNANVLNANNSITTAGQTIGGLLVNTVTSTSGLNAIDFYGYWKIDASLSLMTVNYDASFRALNIDLGSNPADVRVLKTSSFNAWNDGIAANNGSNTTMHTLNGSNVHNDRVYSIENLLGFSGFTFGFNGATLPIQLSSFTGETDNAVNYLKWTTQSEQNSSHFEIERSVDAINFEKIGRVNAMGVSNQVKQYSFNDVNPIRGMNYYRLKLVDIDGTNSNSNTIALEIKGKETTFILFPNPTTDAVSYQYEAETNESLNMEVVNALGQVVISQTRAARVGTNSISLNMSELAPGAYTVRVKHMVSGITHSEKIIKK